MKSIAVIPARYASVRFPAKALALLCGKPMIQQVYEAVLKSGVFAEVIIATDSDLILQTALNFGAKAVLTSPNHQSGSDRIAEAIANFDADLIFNVQGDEPLIDQISLEKLQNAFLDPLVQVATLKTKIESDLLLIDPNIVKVITDAQGDAIYFSRSPIPFNRDLNQSIIYYRHIGVYAYKREALLHFVKLAPSELEQIEKLEQLRLLEHRIPIRVIETTYQGIGIDTPEDLILVEKLMQYGATS